MLSLRKPSIFLKLGCEQSGQQLQLHTHSYTYAHMLTICITAIIYYIIINAAYEFIKSTYIPTVSTKVLSTILIKWAKSTY